MTALIPTSTVTLSFVNNGQRYLAETARYQLERMSQRIRARAIRRAGELLKMIEPATGKNNQYAQVKGEDVQPFQSRQAVAEQAGMSVHQAKQAIRVANVPVPCPFFADGAVHISRACSF